MNILLTHIRKSLSELNVVDHMDENVNIFLNNVNKNYHTKGKYDVTHFLIFIWM